MFKILLSSKAAKDLRSISQSGILDSIVLCLNEMKDNPFRGDVRKLENFPYAEFRKRKGDYRILFDINLDNKSIEIKRVIHRKDAYKG